MKVREKINLFIDLLLTLALTLIAGIGLLIKYTLPSGRERIIKYGDNRELSFLGWDRHQWGEIHLIAAYVMLGLLVLHILFHWKTILCLVRKAIPPVWLRRSLWVTLGVLCLFIFLFAFLATPVREETGDFLHRNSHFGAMKPEVNENSRGREAERGKKPEAAKADRGEKHLHADEDHTSLNGRMTLEDAAIHYGISIEETKRRLGLPAHVDSFATIGRLRKTYGFTMQQARERLEKANEL
ncbi:MAG: DUF4405 domain-containing protein [Acidobacteria bacterium]|nr:DUF4405 domain-containing protein [Acidobacteriota bacterium]MBU4308047.1 DUF4405 domain-containing protein [Acidobacteriota bacterium]MBU4405299.1 DUF4405 domain-containing protein [Acidobacteriota bacterium]MCG2810073.1 DUF4405 domain-containing protein [Candidatus Aminicenantes bacterium]